MMPTVTASMRWSALTWSFALGIAVAVPVVIFRERLLPARFNLDAAVIQQIAQGQHARPVDKSYGVVAEAYRLLGLADNPLGASMVGFTAFAIVVFFALVRSSPRSPSLVLPVAVVVTLCLGAVYLGTYSKDVFALPIVAAFLAVGKRWWWDVALIVLMLAYGGLVRQYWLIIGGGYAVLRVIAGRRPRPIVLVAGACALILVSALGFAFVLHVQADYFRTLVNSRPAGSPAESMIVRFIDVDSLASLNVLLTFASLLVPLPLLLKGGLYYTTLAIAETAAWVFLVLAIQRRSHPSSPVDATFARGAVLFAVFVATGALFEPDYGSALRHLTALLPLALYLVARGYDPKERMPA